MGIVRIKRKLLLVWLFSVIVSVTVSYSQSDTSIIKNSSPEAYLLSPLFKQILEMYKKGLKAYIKGDYPAAIENAQNALLLDPLQQECYILLKQAKAKIGITESKGNVKAGDAIDSVEQSKMFARGMQLYLLKEYYNALRHWELLSTINGKYPELQRYIEQVNKDIATADSLAAINAKAQKYLTLALKMYQEKNKNKTLQYLDTTLQIYPGQTEALILRSRIYNETKAEYDRILEYGKSLYSSGNYKKTIDVWKSGYGLMSDNSALKSLVAEAEKQIKDMKEFFLKEAQAYLEKDELNTALVNYQKAFEITPDDKDLEKNITIIHVKIESERNRLLKIALDEYTKGNYSKAAEGFRKVLEISPEYAPAKEYEQQCSSKILKIQADEVLLQNRIKAKEMEVQDNINEALYFWNQVLNTAPSDMEAMEAVKRINRKAETKQKNIVVNLTYTKSMELYRNGKYQDARLLWKQILENDPENTQIKQMLSELEQKKQSLIQKGDLLADKGEYALAVREYNNALRTDPSNQSLKQKVNQAELKVAEQDEQKSSVSSKEIEELISKGLEYYMAQQFDNALATWSSILKKDPANSRVQSYITNLKNKMRKLDQL
jgi:tetratricopeptide (TPR) repeat protein